MQHKLQLMLALRSRATREFAARWRTLPIPNTQTRAPAEATPHGPCAGRQQRRAGSCPVRVELWRFGFAVA